MLLQLTKVSSFTAATDILLQHTMVTMVTMVTMGGDLQPGCLADRLLTGLGQPQIIP